jgi:hypothetical protein
MIRFFYIVSLLIIFCNCSNDKLKENINNDIFTNNEKDSISRKISLYNNGEIKKILMHKNGKICCVTEEYDTTGTLTLRENYKYSDNDSAFSINEFVKFKDKYTIDTSGSHYVNLKFNTLKNCLNISYIYGNTVDSLLMKISVNNYSRKISFGNRKLNNKYCPEQKISGEFIMVFSIYESWISDESPNQKVRAFRLKRGNDILSHMLLQYHLR